MSIWAGGKRYLSQNQWADVCSRCPVGRILDRPPTAPKARTVTECPIPCGGREKCAATPNVRRNGAFGKFGRSGGPSVPRAAGHRWCVHLKECTLQKNVESEPFGTPVGRILDRPPTAPKAGTVTECPIPCGGREKCAATPNVRRNGARRAHSDAPPSYHRAENPTRCTNTARGHIPNAPSPTTPGRCI